MRKLTSVNEKDNQHQSVDNIESANREKKHMPKFFYLKQSLRREYDVGSRIHTHIPGTQD